MLIIVYSIQNNSILHATNSIFMLIIVHSMLIIVYYMHIIPAVGVCADNNDYLDDFGSIIYANNVYSIQNNSIFYAKITVYSIQNNSILYASDSIFMLIIVYSMLILVYYMHIIPAVGVCADTNDYFDDFGSIVYANNSIFYPK